MTTLRILLSAIFISIAVYTGFVVADHGLNLLPIFFGDIVQMAWPGQFNFDFLCFLILSASWVAWRHQFSGAGIMLGILAFFGGAFFLSGYLLFHSYRSEGSIQRLLLGTNSAA